MSTMAEMRPELAAGLDTSGGGDSKNRSATGLAGRPLVAPLWHTMLLVGLFVALALLGAGFQTAARSQPGIVSHSGVLPMYTSIIAVEWGLIYYVWKGGLRRRGLALWDLIGGRWNGWRSVFRDGALAAGLWGTWTLVSAAWDHAFSAGDAVSIQPFLPQVPLEIALWVAVSLSAGICEEIVFRGYFLRQFRALTGSRIVGLLLQAGLFGISHGYQGAAASLKIVLFGALYGAVALWRGSLRPGILAHAGSDILSGIFRI